MSLYFIDGDTCCTDVVQQIEKYGTLHTGTLHRRYYYNQVESNYKIILDFIKNSNWFFSPDFSKPNGLVAAVGKIIRLTHTVINLQSWRDPIVVSLLEHNHLTFDTGGKRVISTFLTKPNPYMFGQALLFNPIGQVIDEILDNPTCIANNHQLADLFKDAILENTKVELGIKFGDGVPYLSCFDGLMPINNPVGTMQEIKNFAKWRQHYTQPRIYISSKCPATVSDSFHFWTQVSTIDEADYILENYTLRNIYLEDLILWMDLEHREFNDAYSRFKLIGVKHDKFKKVISVRHV